MSEYELCHYGVKGMKWGVRRARKKSEANTELARKALSYDIKSANLAKKAEKLHAKHDLEGRNKLATKANKLDAKAAKLQKKANVAESESKRYALEKKSAKLQYKSAKLHTKANTLARTKGYSAKAMKYAIKSDKVAAKAAKTRREIANNNYYISMTKRKVSEIPDATVRAGYEWVNDL